MCAEIVTRELLCEALAENVGSSTAIAAASASSEPEGVLDIRPCGFIQFTVSSWCLTRLSCGLQHGPARSDTTAEAAIPATRPTPKEKTAESVMESAAILGCRRALSGALEAVAR